MEGCRILKKIPLNLAHLPTYLLGIGYITFWIELYWFDTRQGVTSPLATILFLIVSVLLILKYRKDTVNRFETPNLQNESLTAKLFMIIGCGLVFAIILCAFYSSLLPPHLKQEYDVLNYHLTLPRQHLILNSFAHIPWSSADLFILPVDFALAPYWLATPFPNKVPQFFFLMGMTLVAIRAVQHLSRERFYSTLIILFAIFGTHHFGIQMGTAMLDIVLVYLFLAALDSFWHKAYGLSAMEFAFYFWSKAFVPFQFIFITLIVVLIAFILKKFNIHKINWGFQGEINLPPRKEYLIGLKKFIIPFILLSIIIGGPFMAKSVYYSGTPLYPFAPGVVKVRDMDQQTVHWQSIQKASKAHLSTKDNYGYGRSAMDFIKHFWIIAVPDKGVNNKYDYPVGLVYLLFLGPFIYLFFQSLRKKELAILPWFIVVYWLSWWFGSQQSRFLYIPILLLFIVVAVEFRSPSKILMGAMTLALVFNLLSVFRAHKQDFFLNGHEVLREKDRELIKVSKSYIDAKRDTHVFLEYPDVAFAQFPVTVTKEKMPFVLAMD